MSKSSGLERISTADEELIRLVATVTIGWVIVFTLASIGLVVYGEHLMELFV